MTPEYKAEKEASVANLGGGGMWEINHVTLVAPAAYFLWSILQSRQSFFKPYTVPAYITDFLLQCCAILFATTVYSDAPQVLNGLLILPAIAAYLQPAPEKQPALAKAPKIPEPNGKPADSKDDGKSAAGDLDALPQRPFITSYRGAMMIVTCASILAVDFPVFPRRFAKTESFGTSLMDMGVGSFVFASGIVAARQMLKEEFSQSPPTFTARMKAALRHSLPLAVLGLVRFWSVKGLDYAEHVSEYGVHWNFFFTLALLPPVIALMQPLLWFMPSLGLLAFIIGVIYELVLYITPGMKVYIILSSRVEGDWLSQNREGVFSFIGYLAIFIGGMGIGTGILPRDRDWDMFAQRPQKKTTQGSNDDGEHDTMDEDADWLAEVMGHSKPKEEEKEVNPLFLLQAPPAAWFHLFKWTLIWFVLAVWAFWNYGPHLVVSRRMANLGYVIWVCAFNTTQLLMFCLIEQSLFPNVYSAKSRDAERSRAAEATSKVLQAFNRNGLALFLLANLLTGALNMSMKTWHLGDVESMTVLVGYVATICGTGLILDHMDISVKL